MQVVKVVMVADNSIKVSEKFRSVILACNNAFSATMSVVTEVTLRPLST